MKSTANEEKLLNSNVLKLNTMLVDGIINDDEWFKKLTSINPVA